MYICFNLIGRGCNRCENRGDSCQECERNPNLMQLKDNYKKMEMKPLPPPPGGADETDPAKKIKAANRRELGRFGIRPQE